jgi:uncharacterized membrane protein YagU involved in acid resistance
MTYTTNVILTQKYEVLKPLKVLLAGFVATGAMTLFMIIAPFIGLPKMNFGEFMGALLGDSMVAGWFMHFAIGIIYAFVYVMFFNHTIPVIKDVFRGMCYGILIFMASEIILTTIMMTREITWAQRENMAVLAFGNCIAHLIYGATLGAFFKNK